MRYSLRQALIQDRERRSLELQGIRAAQRIGLIARLHAVSAFRTGNDPSQAVRDVIMGNQRLGLPGIAPLLTKGMVAAHLRGIYRTMLTTAPMFRANATQKLAATAYDGAIEYLKKKLALTDIGFNDLQRHYVDEALAIAGRLADNLQARIAKTMIVTTQKGSGVREGITALRGAFTEAGVMPAEDYQLEAIFRTETQKAYSAGRWNSQQDEAVQEILWGYEFVAVEDDRTTVLCQTCDGTRRPKDDPFWQRFTPPLHWNCRSSAVERFNDQENEVTPVPEGVEPQEGFGYPGGRISIELSAAWNGLPIRREPSSPLGFYDLCIPEMRSSLFRPRQAISAGRVRSRCLPCRR